MEEDIQCKKSDDELDTSRPKAGERWILVENINDVGEFGVNAGWDTKERAPAFVARAKQAGYWVPCKVVLSKGNLTCYLPNGQTVQDKNQFSILQKPTCCQLTWLKTLTGQKMPDSAVIGGHSDGGLPLYIGRTESGIICDCSQIKHKSVGTPETYEVLVHEHV